MVLCCGSPSKLLGRVYISVLCFTEEEQIPKVTNFKCNHAGIGPKSSKLLFLALPWDQNKLALTFKVHW